MVYLTIAIFFGLAGGVVGRLKGSSFLLWFVISACVPVLGLAAAVLYRYESDELRRACGNCGKVVMAYDAICTRCGNELDFPSDDELVAPASHVAGRPSSQGR